MDLGTLVTHVANRTGNDAANNVFIEFLNQIQQDMASRYHFDWRYSNPVRITIPANTKYINPSAYLPDFGEPYECIELSTPQKLIYDYSWNFHVSDPDYAKTTPTRTGTPSHYNVDWANERMWFYPQTGSSTINIMIRYLKDPPNITASNATLMVPPKWHYVVAAGMESYAWQMDEDLNSAKIAAERYEMGIMRMIDEANNRPDFQPIFQTPQPIVDYSDPFLEV